MISFFVVVCFSLGLNPYEFFCVIGQPFIDCDLRAFAENPQSHDHTLRVVNHLFLSFHGVFLL